MGAEAKNRAEQEKNKVFQDEEQVWFFVFFSPSILTNS